MNVRRVAAAALLGLACVAGTGCVSKPVVALDHAEIRSASPGGLGLVIFLRVNNKNAFDVQVRNVRGQPTIAGGFALAPLDMSPNVWLPAGQTTAVAVPVVVPWNIVPAILAQTLGSPTVTYHFRGTADVTAVRLLGVQRNDYPVDEDGVISRQAMVAAAASVLPFRVQ
jgi:hypothetical protein